MFFQTTCHQTLPPKTNIWKRCKNIWYSKPKEEKKKEEKRKGRGKRKGNRKQKARLTSVMTKTKLFIYLFVVCFYLYSFEEVTVSEAITIQW